MKTLSRWLGVALLGAPLIALAGVSAEEAARLRKDLTPLGAERTGNSTGSIPAWAPVTPTGKVTGRRPDPFAADKPLYTVTVQNMAQHAAVLTDGLKALFAKYPDYRLDVYPTRRTAAAPAYVYENTRKNATRATLHGDVMKGALGGIPFPLPKSGAEVMWNTLTHWEGANYQYESRGYLVTAEGQPVLALDAKLDVTKPYYYENASLESFERSGVHAQYRIVNIGPAVRAGEGFLQNQNIDPTRDESWLYLTGQRRVRKVPNACCDSPAPQTAGIMSFDEQLLFTGRFDRFDWKLLGKQEMLIPYNGNRILSMEDEKVVGKRFVEPTALRWELHRVWVVEATLRAGQRHTSPRGRYYVDEDTWIPVLADRWDQKGQLWRTLFQVPTLMSDLPGQVGGPFGMYDLLSGSWFINGLQGSKPSHRQFVPAFPEDHFTAESLAGQSIR